MFRPIDIVMIGLLLGGAAFTFKIKHDSEQAIARVAELERQIRAERDAIDVLKADWSLLTDPKRLAGLIEKYQAQLDLAPLEPGAIVTLDDIPMRPPQLEPADTGIAGLIEADRETVTGAIKRETNGGNGQ